jgi:RNA polymerase sigma-70 factor (ECF subfamily)
LGARRRGSRRPRGVRLAVGNVSATPSDILYERDELGAPDNEVAVQKRELVERAGRGDHDAFAVLVGASIGRLDAAARLILRDPELARDAVQDGFINAWRALPTLRDPERFDAWLRRLVVRSCIDAVRRRGRRTIEVELTPLHAPVVGDIAAIVADRDLLDAALQRLVPEWRAVVVLHYYLGLPLPDVAATLGIPLGTAKSRLHRSLAEMRRSIDSSVDPTPVPVAEGQYA